MKSTVSTGKDNFYPQIFRLAIPIIIQNLLSAAVNSADVIMLNYVGQSAISAVSLAANYSNILFMVYYGTGNRSVPFVFPVFRQKELPGHPCSRRNCPSFFRGNIHSGGIGGLYYAPTDDDPFYI